MTQSRTEPSGASGASSPPAGTVDPRQPRTGAAFTAVLLLVGTFLALLGPAAAGTLGTTTLAARVLDPGFLVLLLTAVLFTWSLVAPRSHPFTAIFRSVVRPRLGPPSEWEDLRPPRFAQGVGLVVVSAGLLLHLLAVPWALPIAGAAAFIAAFLNAAFGFCLGCELYLLLARLRAPRRA